jgi:hypothetical protein
MYYMADRHQCGMEAAIDRLHQVSEELECHRDDHGVIIVREIKKVERKKMKIVKQIKLAKGITHLSTNGNNRSSASSSPEDEALLYTS